jgi:hypothetical protein
VEGVSAAIVKQQDSAKQERYIGLTQNADNRLLANA